MDSDDWVNRSRKHRSQAEPKCCQAQMDERKSCDFFFFKLRISIPLQNPYDKGRNMNLAHCSKISRASLPRTNPQTRSRSVGRFATLSLITLNSSHMPYSNTLIIFSSTPIRVNLVNNEEQNMQTNLCLASTGMSSSENNVHETRL